MGGEGEWRSPCLALSAGEETLTLHLCPTFPSHPAQSCPCTPLPRGPAAPHTSCLVRLQDPLSHPNAGQCPQGLVCSHTRGALQPLTRHSSWPALTASKMKNCTHSWDLKANLPFSAFFYSLGTPSPGQLLVRGHGHYILGVFSSVPQQGWGQAPWQAWHSSDTLEAYGSPRAVPMAATEPGQHWAPWPCLPVTSQGQQRFGVI